MESAEAGARQRPWPQAAAGGTALGLLPGSDRSEGNAHLTLSLPTGLGELRNALLVRSVDALVAVGGSPEGNRPVDLRDAKGNGSGIVAFDKKTGKEKWKATDELASYSSPVLATFHDKKTVLYFARGGLVGLDPTDGKERFKFPWRAKGEESVNAACPLAMLLVLTVVAENGPADCVTGISPE